MKDKYINIQIPILDGVNGMEVVKTFTEEQLWYVCAIAKAFEELQEENQKLKELQCTFQGTGCQNKMKKYKEVIDKLRADLNLLIKYADGEDASKYDKQYGEFAKNHLKYMDKLLKEVK